VPRFGKQPPQTLVIGIGKYALAAHPSLFRFSKAGPISEAVCASAAEIAWGT
jgi:hypothetical protein